MSVSKQHWRVEMKIKWSLLQIEQSSKSASTEPMEVPSHSTSTEQHPLSLRRSHLTEQSLYPRRSYLTQHLWSPCMQLLMWWNSQANLEAVIHLRGTMSHLTDSADSSSHATKSMLPLQQTVLPYCTPVEPYHPSMPYGFNPTSSHYSGEPTCIWK